MYSCRNNARPSNIRCTNPNNFANQDSCGFGNDSMTAFPTNYMYGQSYVPIQYIDQTFKPDAGLKMGTMFPELVSPYTPGQVMLENSYLRNSTYGE